MDLPLLLYPAHSQDPHFRYACGVSLEQGLYLRFAPNEDLLIVKSMEVEQARSVAGVKEVLDREQAGWQADKDQVKAWAKLAADLLRLRDKSEVRVSPLLPAAFYEHLRSEGLDPQVDILLFERERRHKTEFELKAVREAQEAAMAACLRVIRELARATITDGQLWRDGQLLTSERLKVLALEVLWERGCSCEQIIIAGFPHCAMPHDGGSGPILSNAPVVIDIFPRHLASGYYGDLTRTVVPGKPSPQVVDMHRACYLALQTGLEKLAPGSDAGLIHRAVVGSLLESGYSSKTPGLEGKPNTPCMLHFTGHGVGLEIHELPFLANLSMAVEVGEALAVEPGLYHQEIGGVRLEDLIRVTDRGVDNLTTLPYSLNPEDYL